MKRLLAFSLVLLIAVSAVFMSGCRRSPAAIIFIDRTSDRVEELAAKEIRKYIYLRTGVLPEIRKWENGAADHCNAIIVGKSVSPMMNDTGYQFPELGEDSFILKTIKKGDFRRLLVAGGSSAGTLYAAYHLAEHMGLGFYLEGDIVPDKRIGFVFPELDIKQDPLFRRRGIQPFHDFPEGPDWWDKEDFRAVLAQLPKLKMNFIGLHTYPEGSVGPEPLTWIGLPEDLNSDGTVNQAYHSHHFTTANGTAGYNAKKTSAYSFGTGQLFCRDNFGAGYMKDRAPWPAPADEAGLFNDMGAYLADVLAFAKDLGIASCLGTEIPLVLPDQFINRLKKLGLDPESPDVREKIYEGIFTRIKKTHPLDFYWFWTPEGWTWLGNSKKDIDNTVRDFKAALKALEIVKPGFSLATSGWVLGPASDRAMFDKYLPKDMAFSCINRNLGWENVDTAFASIKGREKWVIPWMEDDPAMTIPQFWAGRMRRDAADAYAYGCDGLFGIHWRTQELSMNVSALAKAAWEQPWNPEKGRRIEPSGRKQYLETIEGADHKSRDLECRDFYRDWCRIQFGEEVSDQIADIFISLDGVTQKTTALQSGLSRLPRPADWTDGPGGIANKNYSWDSVKVKFDFISGLEKLDPEIKGNGNRQRFSFWLDQFRYLRAFEMLACTMHDFNIAMTEIQKAGNIDKAREANDKLVPIIMKEGEELREIHKWLLSSVSTWGGIGNITNWQQHNIEGQIMPQIRKVTKLTGDSSWVKSFFPDNIPEISRMIVPSPQTIIREGSDYTVRVICLNIKPGDARIYWRTIGEKEYRQADLKKITDTWLQAEIPASEINGDFEYHISLSSGMEYVFPVTAPDIDQAVVVLRK